MKQQAVGINAEYDVDIRSLILDFTKDIERRYEHIDKNKLSILFSPEPPAADNYYLQDKDNKSMTTSLCDRPKITEVLFNLIYNAVKFTEHGSVSIYLKAHSFYKAYIY